MCSTQYMPEVHICLYRQMCVHTALADNGGLSHFSSVTTTKQVIILLITEPEGLLLWSSGRLSFSSFLTSSLK